MGSKTKQTSEVEKQTKKTEQQVEQKKETKQSKKQEEQKTAQPVPESQTTGSQSDDKFEEQLKTIETTYSETKKLMHELHTSIKKLQSVHKSEVKKARVKKNKRSEKHKPTGFARLRPVSGKMAEFIGVASGTEMSGPSITKQVWRVLKERGLTFKGDKANGVKGDQRVLRADNEVSELFFVPMSVNNSTTHNDDKGFNFGNLQFYIKQGLAGKKLERKQKLAKPESQTTTTTTTKQTKTLTK